MFDPLNDHGGFGSDDLNPPWPATPHPNSPIPNLRRPTTPKPSSQLGAPASPFGKEPQVYGQPEQGLISPQVTVGANGAKYEKPEQYLRVRITGLDRNRRDILVRFDAQTNMTNFTGNTYRNVQRSYLEFQQFYESLIHSCPQTIVPALPFAQTSAPTDEEDDRLVKIMLQRWLTRICEDPILVHDEEVRSFIESDFGYQPTPRPRRKAGSGFSLIRRGVPDEDEELQRARFELTKLEGQFFDAAKAVDKLTRARKSLAQAHAEMGNKLINVATTEAHPPLGNTLRKIGRTWHSLADLDQAQAISECVILGDSLGYQGLNARSAKETLQMRTAVLEEYQAAVKTTISKRRNIERLKASSNIRPEKVDEALEEMEEASKYEHILAKRGDGISQNLHRALQTHTKQVTDDITAALIEHARSSIMYERQLLRELETLRPDVDGVDQKVVVTNGVPKPTVVPKLEDEILRPPPPADPIRAPVARGPAPVPPLVANGPLAQRGLPPSPPIQSPPALAVQHNVGPQGSLQSPGAGPSSNPPTRAMTQPTVVSNGPPLGGRFVDGTKSMFISPSPRVAPPASPATASPISPNTPRVAAPPLTGPAAGEDPLSRPTSAAQLGSSTNPLANGAAGAPDVDPLGGVRPNFMSASVRVQPTRPRLDAREAASKLANMF
ncbi:hypothetical protein PUNSTDRAFT_132620 [Punctularia strigosozonata HHB-11173 SS5]|uniref:uncharacterized protein n=1 Tax=Punctularia strigosozonata (strain HHB-11173) TaxID=741275 RepID=UPI00044174B6|nr:uncharacterized protein PUNSTDRAFT_132620 [Punctularia strigosozonata HHB-11173 SS5]EIN10530.1 hypothetical protein PUNSTDRAFT_132620 [Punctularia strigosozonata HHB-11173 SS5]